MHDLQIPASLRPADGRFGCGPTKVRDAQLEALRTCGLMGTSHRQAPVRGVVHDIRTGLATLFTPPDGYAVALGNGGSSCFWALATACLIRRRSAHAVFGEFGRKFAAEASRAPFLADPVLVQAPAGDVARLTGAEGSSAGAAGAPPDVFAYPHNETSTGATSPVRRIGAPGTLTVVDATSIAGAAPVDLGQVDAYYFSPQKSFGSDGGLWFALLSPAAQRRASELHAAHDRWVPAILDLRLALDNSAKDQTLNTPAIATLVLMREQIRWMLERGGLAAMAARARANSDLVYAWARHSDVAHPFVRRPEDRSPVVATIDFDREVDAAALARVLRANGIVDVEPYRKLHRNQLRVGTYPAVERADVQALLACIDWVIERL